MCVNYRLETASDHRSVRALASSPDSPDSRVEYEHLRRSSRWAADSYRRHFSILSRDSISRLANWRMPEPYRKLEICTATDSEYESRINLASWYTAYCACYHAIVPMLFRCFTSVHVALRTRSSPSHLIPGDPDERATVCSFSSAVLHIELDISTPIDSHSCGLDVITVT